MMRKLICVLLAIMLPACVFAGCNKSDDVTVSMYDLSRVMLEAFDAGGEMVYVSSSDDSAQDKFSYLSDMDYSLVDAFFMAYAADGNGNADEIAVIAVKNERDASAAGESLNAHVEKRAALYSTYDPSQLEKLEGAEVFVSGRYAVLIVGDNAQAVKTSFQRFITG